MKKAPEELAKEVLKYCENAGYTVKDVIELDLAINRSIREMEWFMEENTKFNINAGQQL